jgi:hypothetical protein
MTLLRIYLPTIFSTGVDVAVLPCSFEADDELAVGRTPFVERVEGRAQRGQGGRLAKAPPAVAGHVQRGLVPVHGDGAAVKADVFQS